MTLVDRNFVVKLITVICFLYIYISAVKINVYRKYLTQLTQNLFFSVIIWLRYSI